MAAGRPAILMNKQQLRFVQRIQSGDAGAARELFLRYQKPIFWKISRAIHSDTANLEDVAGEVYLALIEGLRKDIQAMEKALPPKYAYVHGVRDVETPEDLAVEYIYEDPAGEARLRVQRDALGRVVAETQNGRTIRYAYDAQHRCTARTAPAGW